jgi:hypothetical protein
MAKAEPTSMIEEELARHGERYRTTSPALIAAEFDVLGSDYHANGYTTRAQADILGERTGLSAGSLLVDLGSGCGWPGLYLTGKHGCRALSVDPVIDGSRVAAQRASDDGLSDRAWSVVGAGDRLPVRTAVADAVVHTDVLC